MGCFPDWCGSGILLSVLPTGELVSATATGDWKGSPTPPPPPPLCFPIIIIIIIRQQHLHRDRQMQAPAWCDPSPLFQPDFLFTLPRDLQLATTMAGLDVMGGVVVAVVVGVTKHCPLRTVSFSLSPSLSLSIYLLSPGSTICCMTAHFRHHIIRREVGGGVG